jgi:hypothetical protein
MIVLDHAGVPAWLMERELLAPDAVLDGDLVVRDASSRNRNYRVETNGAAAYLLKQGIGSEAAATVANEAAVYRYLGTQPALTGILPALYRYEADEGVLVLELIAAAQDLRTHHASTGRFSAGPAAALGTSLGALHRTTRRQATPVPAAATWALALAEPPLVILRDISAAGIELVRVIQNAPGLGEALGELRESWLPEALVHGDLKWENCLVSDADGVTERVRLVDWEAAVFGDPGWDIGSALAQYLSFWVFSIPITGADPPERFPELAAYPLDAMKPALASCWMAYQAAMALPPANASSRLVRAVSFCGVRLIQTAFEAAQYQQTLTSAVVLHLQLAHNILLRPEEAATRLLGLPLHPGGGA